MKLLSLLLLILGSASYAAPAAAPATTLAAPTAAAPVTGTVSTAPAPTPNPWKVSYFGEYAGPRLSNFDLTQSQGPLDAQSDYTAWAHSFKVGYKITGDIVMGTQLRAVSPFNPAPTANLSWRDLRVYGSWAHMIDTSDIDMQAILEVEMPTTLASKNKGQLLRFNIKNNWTFKTSLRNLSLSAMTYISPRFFENARGKTDIYFAFSPSINYDLATDLAIVVEGNFDFEHNYDAALFEYLQSDPDTFNVGLNYVINAYLQVNPALTFYTADLTVPTLYFALSAAL